MSTQKKNFFHYSSSTFFELNSSLLEEYDHYCKQNSQYTLIKTYRFTDGGFREFYR